MNLFNVRCTDEAAWVADDTGTRCPDCAAFVLPDAIAAHIAWHEGLIRQLVGVGEGHGETPIDTPALDLGAPGDCVRFLHELQIERLRQPSPTSSIS
jgi:hypothetical protein